MPFSPVAARCIAPRGGWLAARYTGPLRGGGNEPSFAGVDIIYSPLEPHAQGAQSCQGEAEPGRCDLLDASQVDATRQRTAEDQQPGDAAVAGLTVQGKVAIAPAASSPASASSIGDVGELDLNLTRF